MGLSLHFNGLYITHSQLKEVHVFSKNCGKSFKFILVFGRR